MADKKERIKFGFNNLFYLDLAVSNRNEEEFYLLEGKELQRAFDGVRNSFSCQVYYHIILEKLKNYRNDRKIIVRFHQCFIGDEENYKDYCTKNPNISLQYIEIDDEILIGAFSSFESHVTQSVFCQEINFSHTTLNHPMYFSDTEFQQKVNFTDAEFKQEVDFVHTKFQQEVRFDGTEFQQKVNFTHAEFQQEVDFVHTKFKQEVDFVHTKFQQKVDFAFAEFQQNVYFFNAKFQQEVDFTHAEFQQKVRFTNAEFQQKVDFSHTKFQQKVDFTHAEFQQDADFSDTKFQQEVRFNRAKFKQDADFSNIEFKQDAGFSNIEFQKDVNFARTTFSGKTDFLASKCKQELNFKYCNFIEIVDFSKLTCDWVPNFRLCTFQKAISLNQLTIPAQPPSAQIVAQKQKVDIADRYRRLKVMAQEAGDRDLQLSAFAGEMEMKLQGQSLWQKSLIPLRLYKWLSNYGQSLLRPIFALLLIWVVFASIYLHMLYSPILKQSDFIDMLVFSATNMVPFTNNINTNLLNSIVANEASGYFYGMAFLQRILGLPLLFLFGLALRNKFLMK